MACRLFACLLLLTCTLYASAQPGRGAAASGGVRYQSRGHAFGAQLGVGVAEGCATASLGFTYEQFMDKDGKLSLFVPAHAYRGGSLAIGEIDEGQLRSSIKGFFAAPGLRYHPSGNTRRVDFSLGLAVMLGLDLRNDTYRPRAYSQEHWLQQDNAGLLTGVLGQLQVQFQSWRSDVFGLFLNTGYCTGHVAPVIHESAGGNLYLQFGLSFGRHW